MRRIIIIFFILNTTCTLGQTGVGIDNVQVFSMDTLTYEFNLQGQTQGLYLGQIVYAQRPPRITLKITNNTNDTIIRGFKERGSHLTWIRMGGNCGRCDTMLPNDYMLLKSFWVEQNPKGSYAQRINITYQNDEGTNTCVIKTWGELYPEGQTPTKRIEIQTPSVVESKNNKLKIDSNSLHYLNHGTKIALDEIGKCNYYIKLSSSDRNAIYSNGNRSEDFLDSLRQIIFPFNASINWAMDGLVVSCDVKKVTQVVKALNSPNLFIMPSQNGFLIDTYEIVFQSEVKQARIEEILAKIELEKYFLKEPNVVFIHLKNSPRNNNNPVTKKISSYSEVKSIDQLYIQLAPAIGN